MTGGGGRGRRQWSNRHIINGDGLGRTGEETVVKPKHYPWSRVGAGGDWGGGRLKVKQYARLSKKNFFIFSFFFFCFFFFFI